MRYTKLFGLGLLAVALVVAGCKKDDAGSKKDTATEKGSKKDEHKHAKGPHNGDVFDLGAFHGEFTVDHAKKEATIYILAQDEKTAVEVECKELTVTTKEAKTKDGKVVPPMTIKMLPQDEVKGKSSKFVGTDPGLENVADYDGRVIGKINGKPAEGDF